MEEIKMTTDEKLQQKTPVQVTLSEEYGCLVEGDHYPKGYVSNSHDGSTTIKVIKYMGTLVGIGLRNEVESRSSFAVQQGLKKYYDQAKPEIDLVYKRSVCFPRQFKEVQVERTLDELCKRYDADGYMFKCVDLCGPRQISVTLYKLVPLGVEEIKIE